MSDRQTPKKSKKNLNPIFYCYKIKNMNLRILLLLQLVIASYGFLRLIDPLQIIRTKCIITNKENNIYKENDNYEEYINAHDSIKNKRLITISPGGFKGFYLLGILSYIKDNYNMDDYIFSGASAGSWNALFMCYKKSALEFAYNLLDYNIQKAKSIVELQYFIKYKLLSQYKDDDFDFDRLFIGVTNFQNFKPHTNIFSDFENLEDAINCCMASSHIPFITGGLTNRYHNMYSFDGGFDNYPYLKLMKPSLHVSPSMWDELSDKKGKKKNKLSLKQYSEFFSASKNNLLELYDHGYEDAKKHKHLLDEVFLLEEDKEDLDL